MTSSITRPLDILEEEYNKYPYQSLPFPQTHPRHLYTLAKLFGLEPTPVEKSRILELGCASGGNLIPIAFDYPESECLGIDLADKQIQEGLQQISDLKLNNIRLRHQSILDFTVSEGKFDYIICHGVYSWVDSVVREKIFNICRDNLAHNGIVYISYNTFPGWNMVNSVRDLMLWHTKDISDPATKATQSRMILKFITDGLQNDPSPYALFLKNEINMLMKHADSYLLHDHLSSYNDPVYFYQFMEQANLHNLSYLADAFPATMFTENLPPVFSNELKKINDIVIAGQYMDFIRNQRFRCTLLCHETLTVNRSLKTTDIESFYLQFIGKSNKTDLNENDIGKNEELSFSNTASTLTIRHALSQWAMFILNQNRDHFMHYEELCDEVMKKSGETDRNLVKQYINEDLNLMRAVLAGLINISSYPSNYKTSLPEKPHAYPLAVYQFKKQGFVVNRRHQAIKLDVLGLVLLPYLDGNHDIPFLEEVLLKAIKDGKLKMLNKENQPIQDETEIKKITNSFCLKALNEFVKQGLLI